MIIITPLSVYFLRYSKNLLNIIPGEITGIQPILISSLISLAPFCLITGLLFSVCSSLFYEHSKNRDESSSVGHIYLLEAFGAAFSGILASFILLKYFSPFVIILSVIILNLISVIHFILNPEKIYTKLLFPSSLVHFYFRISLYTIILFIFFFSFFKKIDRLTEQIKWTGYDLIESEQTIYGNLSVINLDETYHFYNNGLLMFSYPDFYNSEESVHFAMLQNPEAEDILMIGGGLNGSILEILKYKNVNKIDYVELDPELIKIAEKYLPETLFRNEKIRFNYGDGRYFLENSKETYDMILLNLPNPYTIQLNRFYTIEFFKKIKHRLKTNGIFSCRVSSSENFISDTLKDFLKSIYIPLGLIFEQITAVPGESAIFVASNREIELVSDPVKLSGMIKKIKLDNKLINEHYIPFRMSRERMNYLIDKLESDELVIPNTDLTPTAYYFDMVLWSSHFSKGFRSFFVYINQINQKFIFILSLVILYGIFAYFYFRKKENLKGSIYTSVLITGFSGITLEIIILLLFQILYGYIYYQLALILTAFMIGIGIGSYITLNLDYTLKKLIYVQIAFAVMPIFLLAGFIILSISSQNLITFTGKYIIFPVFALLTGSLTGSHFILSTRIYNVKRQKKDWGKIYAIDLVGAAAGALLVSILLIPLFGLKFILTILCGLNLFAALILGLLVRNQ